MEELLTIRPPAGESDEDGARRVFEEFYTLYYPTLTQAERYLTTMVKDVGYDYAGGYLPWLRGLRTLVRGIYLMVKKIPLPDVESFRDALSMFSFDGAIEFLEDLCASCKLTLTKDWALHFQRHIDMLLFSLAILSRTQQEAAR